MITKLFWGDKNELLHVEIGEVNLLHLLNVCYYVLLLKDSQLLKLNYANIYNTVKDIC